MYGFVVESVVMKYKFYCRKCDKITQEEMTISEYEQYEAMCEVCKDPLERVFEPPKISAVGGSGDESDGDGAGSACGVGSCASCPGCSA